MTGSCSNRYLKSIIMMATVLLFIAANKTIVNAAEITSHVDYFLCDGMLETDMYITANDGNNIHAHVLKISKDAGIKVKVSTKQYYKKRKDADSRKKASKAWSIGDWGFSKIDEQAFDYESAPDTTGSVVAGINGDFYYLWNKGNGITYGTLIMEGNTIKRTKDYPFFAVTKDGKYVIREGSSSTCDVLEAVSGSNIIVSNGKVIPHGDDSLQPRMAIGLTDNGDIIAVNIEGRLMDSKGATLKETAGIMKSLGSVNAINLDGGGSANFYTKRAGEKKISVKNEPSEGFVRTLSSSVLFVRDRDERVLNQSQKVTSPKKNKRVLYQSEDEVYHYRPGFKRVKGFKNINSDMFLFDKKGNGMTANVKIGKDIYQYKNGLLINCTDKNAGKIYVGYCGASKDMENLLYAYNNGSGTLNIGVNPYGSGSGKMMSNDTSRGSAPWYSKRGDIRAIFVGKGVTNIGEYFYYTSKGRALDGSKPVKSKLTSISLPSTLTTISSHAFINAARLTNVEVPGSVRKIGTEAFKGSGKGYLRFNSKKLPKANKGALLHSKFERIIVGDRSLCDYLDVGSELRKHESKVINNGFGMLPITVYK